MTEPSDALVAVLPSLRCPICEGNFTASGGSLRCDPGHTFDVARQGYVSFLSGGTHANTGDSADMVTARAAFLGAGHYAPVAEALTRSSLEAHGDTSPRSRPHLHDTPPLCVDLAGGTGYYLAGVVEALPLHTGLSVDLSPIAARHAARAHPRITSVTADVWRPLPIKTSAASIVLNVFGPRNPAEMERILAPDGSLIVVTPTAHHLRELRDDVGLIAVDPAKGRRLAAQLASFTRAEHRTVEYTASLSPTDILNEVTMGPSSHHIDTTALAESLRSAPDQTDVTVSVAVTRYRIAAR